MIAKYFALCTIIFFGFVSCKQDKPQESFDQLVTDYVKLGLTIGKYDGPFVDAYYGPDSLLANSSKDAVFPKDSLLAAVEQLGKKMAFYSDSARADDSLKQRAVWIGKQLVAFGRRIRIFTGESATFDEEATDLFDVHVPVYSESYFQSLVKKVDSILPGNEPRAIRVQHFYNQLIILYSESVDTVFKTAIAEARKRTLEHYTLPANEDFTLEYVHDKPWGGYN